MNFITSFIKFRNLFYHLRKFRKFAAITEQILHLKLSEYIQDLKIIFCLFHSLIIIYFSLLTLSVLRTRYISCETIFSILIFFCVITSLK